MYATYIYVHRQYRLDDKKAPLKEGQAQIRKLSTVNTHNIPNRVRTLGGENSTRSYAIWTAMTSGLAQDHHAGPHLWLPIGISGPVREVQ